MGMLDDRMRSNASMGQVQIASGIAAFNSATDTSFSDVFRRADALMYEQKRQMKGYPSA